jgi:predicted alpha-1,2-mannosidase
MKTFVFYVISLVCMISVLSACDRTDAAQGRDPVDYVNPYMGNISHLLVPTYPTVHLPNSMLRVYPERRDFTDDVLRGLPLIVTSHRGSSAFKLSPFQGRWEDMRPVMDFGYDKETIRPYYYEVYLDDREIAVKYAPSHRSAVYRIEFGRSDHPSCLILNSGNGMLQVDGGTVSGYQRLSDNTNVYLYFETEQRPLRSGVCRNGYIDGENTRAEGRNAFVALDYGDTKTIRIRYGISFISAEQARNNLRHELNDYDVEQTASRGRALWNEALGKIRVEGRCDREKAIFYTSLYRCLERPVCISEEGRYFSAFDGKVHSDDGTPFFTDDWIWDTYRATHPLRVLTDGEAENHILSSYLRMAEQMGTMWMPTFPEITGDSRRMNSNHAVATVIDGYAKGLRGFDLEKAYEACRRAMEEKTLIPWSGAPAGWLDEFYRTQGYIPALHPEEEESVPHVNSFEKRQPVAVTLGTAYDQWCLSQIAGALGKTDEAKRYLKSSFNYRNVYNAETGFFHPKDKEGRFIEPFDYRFSGGMGARDYYGENNGWVYRWDVPHNVADLIRLMGGRERFTENLDRTFSEPLGRGKSAFYAQLPDHTGNVGQFSMANEPGMHIPYLYNYAGRPWKTQKRIRTLLRQWFRDDLMGVPGDEDGGGTSAFVVFSMMGFYPVTPGMTAYNIGSPVFSNVKLRMGNGKTFEVEAKNYAPGNKYIQSARLNGVPWDKPWFDHSDIKDGGKLVLVMGDRANKSWGVSPSSAPPSAESAD